MDELETIIGYYFKDKDILQEAFTHSSYQDSNKNSNEQIKYDRIELLGDAVVGLIISEMLYRKFPDEPEGDLSKRKAALVCGSTLADISRSLGLGKFIKMGTGFQNSNGQNSDSILEDVFESLVGAIYLDAGFDEVKKFVLEHVGNLVDKHLSPPQDPKTKLQEWAQSKGLPIPVYKILEQQGPSHNPLFTIEVSVEGFNAVLAKGSSKREAQREAAKKIYEELTEK